MQLEELDDDTLLQQVYARFATDAETITTPFGVIPNCCGATSDGPLVRELAMRFEQANERADTALDAALTRAACDALKRAVAAAEALLGQGSPSKAPAGTEAPPVVGVAPRDVAAAYLFSGLLKEAVATGKTGAGEGRRLAAVAYAWADVLLAAR